MRPQRYNKVFWKNEQNAYLCLKLEDIQERNRNKRQIEKLSELFHLDLIIEFV